jgi:hypothetical protein
MSALSYRERAADGEPAGMLILHHGRGTDELDLLALADALDPARRLHVVAPRAPLRLPGSPGYHWYVVPRVGYPDPVTSTVPTTSSPSSMTSSGGGPTSPQRRPCSAASRWGP